MIEKYLSSNHSFSSIVIAMLDFSILHPEKLLLFIFFASFLVRISLLFCFISLSKVITLPTIVIAMVVALSSS